MNREQVLASAEQQEIAFAQLEFVDPVGIGRGVLLAREHLPQALNRGINFSVSTMAVSLDSHIVVPELGVQAGDFWAVADPSTYVVLPYLERTAHLFADLVDADGRPWPGCPRAALRRQCAAAAQELGRVTLGFEQEGALVKRENGRPRWAHEGHFFNFDILNAEHPFLLDLVGVLRAMGIEPEKARAENQFGQIELNIRYGEPLAAVEQHWRFKQAFRHLARRHGLIGTFMPKPFMEAQGSGLHLHIGLRDSAGHDLFFDPDDDSGLELSALGRHFLAGLLAHSGGILALGSPSVNSYKRLLPGTWSPAHSGYAVGNRSVFVRVVESRPAAAGGPSAKRLELRSPDGTCNPYFLAIAVIAAGRDGVRRALDPGPALTGHDTAELSAAERERLGARFLPRTLDQALAVLEADEVLREALGPLLFGSFLAAKRDELESYHTVISEREYAHYLEHF